LVEVLRQWLRLFRNAFLSADVGGWTMFWRIRPISSFTFMCFCERKQRTKSFHYC
jgi:hypothetical protein